MEITTHNLVGILIQLLCFKYFTFPLNYIFTIIIAIFSHFLLDILSHITYHTPESHWNDKFWAIWHILIFTSGILTIIIFFIPFWLGILFSYLPDIVDWHILRPIQKRMKKKEKLLNLEYKLVFHPTINWIRDKVFFWLPDIRYKKYGIVVELLIISFLSVLIYFYI